MFSQFSNVFSKLSNSLPFAGGGGTAIDIPPVEVHEIETVQEKPGRALKHLLKLNHANHAILFNDLKFHNHCPHILGSAYLLGADAEHLGFIYEEESKQLEPWRDSPSEISADDWRDFLGKREYERAFVDFFEDELVRRGYDWKDVVEAILFTGKEPVANGLVAGLGHPLIHLGYAYELSSREVATEALGLAATNYSDIHKYLDQPSYSERPPPYESTSLLEILGKIREDSRLDGLFETPGGDNLTVLFRDHENVIVDHWNAWKIDDDPLKQFEDSQRVAAAVLVGTGGVPYDFFFVHFLTTSHAVRILLPFFPAKFHVSLVRQWWLIVVALYMAQLRPEVRLHTIRSVEIKGRDWKWVSKEGLRHKWATDAHFVKALRALMEAAKTWGDDDEFYLKSAIKFADEFDGWGGFGVAKLHH